MGNVVGNELAEEGPARRDSRIIFSEFSVHTFSIFQRPSRGAVAEHGLTACFVAWQFWKEPAESSFRRVWQPRPVAEANMRIGRTSCWLA